MVYKNELHHLMPPASKVPSRVFYLSTLYDSAVFRMGISIAMSIPAIYDVFSLPDIKFSSSLLPYPSPKKKVTEKHTGYQPERLGYERGRYRITRLFYANASVI